MNSSLSQSLPDRAAAQSGKSTTPNGVAPHPASLDNLMEEIERIQFEPVEMVVARLLAMVGARA